MIRIQQLTRTLAGLNKTKLFCPNCGCSTAAISFSTNSHTQVKPLKVKVISTKKTAFPDSSSVLTTAEMEKVLNVVNDVKSSEDLLKFFLSKKKADEVMKRKLSSQISTVDELISIIGAKNSSRFFCRILEKPIPISANSAMFPIVHSRDVPSISSVLSLIIVGDKVTWAVFNRSTNKNELSLNLQCWRQVTYPFKPRMHFLTMLDEIEKVAKEIPDSDLCLVEEYPANVPTPYMFNFQLLMTQAKSMLVAVLNSRLKPPRIVSLKTVAVARLFNTYVGSEKVSGQYLLEDLLSNQKLPFMDIPEHTLESYKDEDAKVKEGLSQAFLLNLAYWKMTKQVK